MKYLRLFETDEDYEDYINNPTALPNVSRVNQSEQKQKYNFLFKDPEVRRILSSKISNGGKPLTLDRIRQITSIGTWFYPNSKIKNFDEFEYFTGVTSLSQHAFRGCGNLVSIKLPKTLTSMAGYAFYSCEKLQSIVIPNGITVLGEYLFRFCYYMNKLVLPSTITNIYNYAFNYLGNKLTNGCNITIFTINPPICQDNVWGFSKINKIYVPSDSVDLYKAAQYWSSYASKIQAIPNDFVSPYE